jgi:hypothetical protein
VVIPVLLWDAARWSLAPSPWELSVRTYGALALAPATQWKARLVAWADLSWYLTASWPVWIALACALLWDWVEWLDRRRQRSSLAGSVTGLLLLWSLVFVLSHVVTTMQVWDRYLLLLAPMLALACGRLAAHWPARLSPRLLAAAALLGLALLWPPAYAASQGELPVGGDHGAYDGLHEAIQWVIDEEPGRFVLYHRVLGWHYQFMLFDPIQAGRIELRWFPSAVYLADNAAKTSYPRKFLIRPDWSPLADLPMYLTGQRLALHRRYHQGRFTVWEITPGAPLPACDWCLCARRRTRPFNGSLGWQELASAPMTPAAAGTQP